MQKLSFDKKNVTDSAPLFFDEKEWNSQQKTHPCFFEKAHLKNARMHVAVAPKCNIQCYYCNRRFDCPNESRPGVASACITPEEALQYVKAAKRKIPQLRVVGIAGPGDPLANPQQTFKTFELIRKEYPELKLCLSTNGLTLVEYADQISDLNIRYITITINAIDPQIGKKIYARVKYQGRFFSSEEGAALLWSRQQMGLKALVERGVMVKVNTVLIPGINDRHIVEVAKSVKKIGAAILNIVPLIPLAKTAFASRRSPTAAECMQCRKQCAPYIRIMHHCRQCRADAVGFLNKDISGEFTKLFVKQKNVRCERR